MSQYPGEANVIEQVSQSFTSSSIYASSNGLVDRFTNVSALLDLFSSSLTSFKWGSFSSSSLVSLVSSSVEALGCLAEIFDERLSASHILRFAQFFMMSVTPSTYHDDVSTSCVIAAASSFPNALNETLIDLLREKKFHIKLFAVLSQYLVMTEMQLINILGSILLFLKERPGMAMNSYESHDKSHLILLFISRHYSSSVKVQIPLWLILDVMVRYSGIVVDDLSNQSELLSTLVTVAKEQCRNTGGVVALCAFVISYIQKTKISLIEAACLDNNELLETLSVVLERSLAGKQCHPSSPSHKDLEGVIKILCLFQSIGGESAACKTTLQSFDALGKVAAGVIKCPICCGVLYSSLLATYVGVLPSSGDFYNQSYFFSVNRILPFKAILSSSLPPSRRDVVYTSLRIVLKQPQALQWLDKEFLEVYLTAVSRDVTQFETSSLQIIIFTTHFITYSLKSKDLVQVLFDKNLHDIAIDGFLKRVTSHEGRISSLSFINCLLRTYQEHLKSIDVIAKSELLQLTVELAHKYGRKGKSGLGDQFGSVVLGLTADKSASAIVYDRGLLDLFYPLVSSDYDQVIVKNAVHCIGNVALAGHHVKQAILSQSLHSSLIRLLDQEMKSADVYLLCACCRVLHILCSGDWAKREFALEGLLDVLIRMLLMRKDSLEIRWRPLGLLSSISFMSLCNRQFLITEPVMDAVVSLFQTAKDDKVISYFSLVFLAFSDMDRHFTYLSSQGIIERVQELMDKGAGNSDFKRWGASVLERGYLFTIRKRKEEGGEEEERLMSLLPTSFTWPPSYTLFSYSKGVQMLQDVESQLAPCFPEGSKTINDGNISHLGLKEPVFRISRLYGSTHGFCSNCEKEGPAEELVFRPHNLTPTQYQSLVTRGWYRRGGVKMFRYRYNHNIDCSDWETRVTLAEFNPRKRKSYRKVTKRMPEDRLTIETVPTQFVQEAYDLYNSYHIAKHDKPKKSRYSYCEHVVNSPMRNQYGGGGEEGIRYGTYHQLYRLDGKLVAVGVIDIVPNGLISIYMWYSMSKEINKYSFGVYSALKEIEYAQELSKKDPNFRYYYLQGWNGNNHKLAYKSNYEPEEFYSPCTVGDWVWSLEGVEAAQKKFKENANQGKGDKMESEGGGGGIRKANGKEVVSGSALPLDRIWYERETGGVGPDVSSIIICINNSHCVRLGELMESNQLSGEQILVMKSKCEELMLALGPELSSNLVIDMKLCPPPLPPPLNLPVPCTDDT